MRRHAQQIVDEFLRNPDFSSSMNMFVNICFTINEVKVRTLGLQRVSFPANNLLQLVGSMWIARAPVSWVEYEMTLNVAQHFRNDEELLWYFPKIHGVSQSIYLKLGTEGMVRAFHPSNEALRFIERLRDSGHDPDALCRTVVDALHERRKYGVKPAYFQDGLVHAPPQAWLILDTDEVRSREMDPLGLNRGCMAWFALANKSDIIGLDTRPRTEDGLPTLLLGLEFPTYFQWFLDREGEFHMQPNGSMPVRSVYRAAGKEDEYSLVKLVNILRLYNLTVPLRIVEELSETTPPYDASGGSHDPGIRPPSLLDPRLVLQRIRRLTENPESLTQAFDEEAGRDEERTLRRIGRHDCVGHARRLPAGHRASPRARNLAAQEGIVLEPNETYVQKHKRGEGNEAQRPHRAVRRNT
ncbi:MAG: hypothetical protein WA001_01225 [Patescibacteria group bacterium]